MVSKKIYTIVVDVTSTVREYAQVLVEAESHDQALKLFDEDPYNYEWTNWETPHRSEYERLDWEIMGFFESPKEVSN